MQETEEGSVEQGAEGSHSSQQEDMSGREGGQFPLRRGWEPGRLRGWRAGARMEVGVRGEGSRGAPGRCSFLHEISSWIAGSKGQGQQEAQDSGEQGGGVTAGREEAEDRQDAPAAPGPARQGPVAAS